MDTATITRRTRNIGFAWSNSARTIHGANGHTWLAVVSPESPDETGLTPRTALALYRETRRKNNSNDWAAAFFVGGRKIAEDAREFVGELDQFLNDPADQRPDSLTVHFAD